MAGLVRVVKRERNEPPSRTARRFAPGIATPLRACGARRRVAMRRYFLVKGGVPPFTLSPRSRGQRTKFAAGSFFRAWLTAARTRWRAGKTTPPPHQHGGAQARERRTPVGTARRRRASGRTRTCGMAPLSAWTSAAWVSVFHETARGHVVSLRFAQRVPAPTGRTDRRPAFQAVLALLRGWLDALLVRAAGRHCAVLPLRMARRNRKAYPPPYAPLGRSRCPPRSSPRSPAPSASSATRPASAPAAAPF